MSRAALQAHATACREAAEAERERPQWEGGSLAGARLTGADLTWAHLPRSDLFGADLSGANLRKADLRGTDLTSAKFSGANLSGADLTSAGLTWADLRGADLRSADLCGADLCGADLTSADLTSARLIFANLSGADLRGATLAEGVACGRAIGGHTGGHCWWAVALESGDVLLQYGCVRRLLRWWLTQGPELSQRHGHPPEHWARGPAVAIAATVELSQALPPVSTGDPAAHLGGHQPPRRANKRVKKLCGFPLPV